MKIRVYYEDTDAGGIVYHANYLKYCERARSEYFFANNVMPGDGEKNGFVVRNITAAFLATAKLGDMLEVSTVVKTLKHSSVTLHQTVYRGSVSLFEMDVVLVYVELGRPRRIPEDFKTLFERFNASASR